MANIPQSTIYVRTFKMYLTGTKTPATGKTIVVNLSKAGGALGAAAGAVAEISGGWYKVSLSAVDSNTIGDLAIDCTEGSCDPTSFTDQVGPIVSNIIQIDGNTTVGNNATLNLKQLNIVNNAGHALVATSSGSNGNGISSQGNGSGSGISCTGGTTGSGLNANGGVTSGHGIIASAQTSGIGISAIGIGSGANGISATGGTNGHGIGAVGNGTGDGIVAVGGVTGNGIQANGGATSGQGIDCRGIGNGIGLNIVGVSQVSLSATQGISGPLDSGERINIADALLKRDMSSVTGEASRSLLNCLRFLRNKWSTSASTLTVTKEDDTTSAWTATVTTNAGAPPIVSFSGN